MQLPSLLPAISAEAPADPLPPPPLPPPVGPQGTGVAIGKGKGKGTGKDKGPPPAPPLPGGGPGGVPHIGGVATPVRSVRTVKLNSTKLQPSALRGSVWAALPAEGEKVELDFARLELLFKVQQPAWSPRGGPRAPCGAGDGAGASVLDPTRARNCGILLQHIRKHLEPGEIVSAIVAVEPWKFGRDAQQAADNLELLQQCSPTDAERAALAAQLPQAGPPRPGDVDAFFRRLVAAGLWAGASAAPACNLGARLRSMALMLNCDERVGGAAQQLVAKRAACTAARGSRALPCILRAVLEIGNFLNHGSRDGNAAGYQLETLLRLGDTRAPQAPGTTLLHFLVQV